MIVYPKLKRKITWKPEQIHKKIGQILYFEPGESDIAEGNFIAQIWFVESHDKWWLLQEWDIRKRKEKP